MLTRDEAAYLLDLMDIDEGGHTPPSIDAALLAVKLESLSTPRAQILADIGGEVASAKSLYNNFHSLHEGYGVLLEEVDELWDMIKASKLIKADDRMKAEAIQIAAMAVRFIEDLYE
jgi:hypothetical protein